MNQDNILDNTLNSFFGTISRDIPLSNPIVEDVDEEEPINQQQTTQEEDYSDMPPLIPLRDRTNELSLWRDLVEDYQNNFREYQRNMDNILRITESVLLRENMNNVVYRPRTRPSFASQARTPTTRQSSVPPSSTTNQNASSRQTSSFSSSPLIQSLLRTFMTPSTSSAQQQSSSSSILRSLLDQRNTPITLMDFEIDGITIPISFSTSTTNSAPSREIINNATETFTYNSGSNDNNNNTCPITLESFIEGERICKIKHCGHIFKDDALKRWFTRNPYCPSCRYDIRNYTE
jgi:hypothetical protein